MRHIGLCPEQDAFYERMSGFDFVRTCARLSGLARRGDRGRRKGHRPGRHDGEHGPADSRLFQRDAAADPSWRRPWSTNPACRFSTSPSPAPTPSPAATDCRDPQTGRERPQRDRLQPRPARSRGAHDERRPCPTTAVSWPRARSRRSATSSTAIPIGSCWSRTPIGPWRPRWSRGTTWRAPRSSCGQSPVLIETRKPDAFYARCPRWPWTAGTPIREVYSDDNNLEAVFKYLVSK